LENYAGFSDIVWLVKKDKGSGVLAASIVTVCYRNTIGLLYAGRLEESPPLASSLNLHTGYRVLYTYYSWGQYAGAEFFMS
jgi:hypothetical protein